MRKPCPIRALHSLIFKVGGLVGQTCFGMLSILSSFNKVSSAWSSSWSNTVLYLLICTVPIDNAVFRIIGLQGFDVL